MKGLKQILVPTDLGKFASRPVLAGKVYPLFKSRQPKR